MKQPRHYLVVDDDATSNLICKFIIQRFNKNAVIHLYTSPEEALQFVKEKECDSETGTIVLFLDINMPTMTGFEFLEEFRELREEITSQFRVYMLTSSIEDFSSRAQEFPMVKKFLSKPLNISYLQQIDEGLTKSINQ